MKTNHEIILENESKDTIKSDFVIVLEKKEGRGKNATVYYHDFSTGLHYSSLDELPEGKKYRIIQKESGDNEWYSNNIYLHKTKASDLCEVDYECVEHENVKFLLLKICNFDVRSTLSSTDETREWTIKSRCYIDNQKNVYPDRNFAWYHDGLYQPVNYKSLYLAFCYHNMTTIDAFEKGYFAYNERLFNAAKEMGWAVVTLGANRRYIMDNGWKLDEFLKYREPVTKSGPKQTHINELVSYELEDVVVPKFKLKKCDNDYQRQENLKKNDFANISAVIGYNKPICCYRTFTRLLDGSYSEGARIYIEEKGKFTACKKTNIGEWVNISLSCNATDFDYKLNYVNNKACKGTILEYLVTMFEDKKTLKESGNVIATTLRHPCIEKLYKSDLKFIIDEVSKSSYTKVWDGIENRLGKLNEKGKTIYAILGLNKQQFSIITQKMFELTASDEPHSRLYNNLIQIVKKCFASSNLSDIDIATFEEMLNFVIAVYEFYKKIDEEGIKDSKGKVHSVNYRQCGDWYDIINCRPFIAFNTMSYISKHYTMPTIKAMMPKILTLFQTYNEKENQRYDYRVGGNVTYISMYSQIDMYHSYMEMVDELLDMVEITGSQKPSPHFSKYDDIKLMHDDIIPVYSYYDRIRRDAEIEFRNQKEAERQKAMLKKQEEAWGRIKTSWDKWTYNNDEYMVIKPERPYDLVVEGTTLGHCVGHYVEKVVKRQTNIMFIRHVSSPEQPLFTVEILSDGTIEQIHGRSNSNIDDKDVMEVEPNIVKFVADWVREKELRLNNINKVR